MVFIFCAHRSEYRLPLTALAVSVTFSLLNLLATWLPILWDLATKYEGQFLAYFLSELAGGARLPVAELVHSASEAVSMTFSASSPPQSGEIVLLRALLSRNTTTKRFDVNGADLPVREILTGSVVDVDLTRRGLDDGHMHTLAQLVIHGRADVESLRLQENAFTVAGASVVGAAVRLRSGVRVINLSGVDIAVGPLRRGTAFVDLSAKYLRDTDAAAIAELIAGNTELRELWLGGQIGDPGAEYLARAVLQSPWLQTLNLGGNRIQDDGARALAHALQRHPGVAKLSLSYNRISSAGAAALAAALATNGVITHLDLENNLIGDGVFAIADMLRTHRTLCRVYLSNNAIKEEGLFALVPALRANGGLTQVYLDGNAESMEAREALRDAWRSTGRVGGLYL